MVKGPDEILRELCEAPAEVLSLLRRYEDDLFESHWREDARLYRAFAEQLIRVGQPTAAFELISEGLDDHPGDVVLLHLRAWALNRGRNLSKAEEYIDELLNNASLSTAQRVDALALAGRIKKDQYRLGPTPERARKSALLYQAAFQLTATSYPAINLATMSLLAGQSEQKVKQLAQAALNLATQELLDPANKSNYWLRATCGESHLLLGEIGQSAESYREAIRLAAGKMGDLASMKQQVRLLRDRLPAAEEILTLFDSGTVVVFAGHMFDRPGAVNDPQRPPRFPIDPRLEHRVGQAIEEELDRLNPAVGYCCGACGSDLLFAEQMVKRNKELHLVLPYAKEDFYKSSVDFGLPEMREYRERFDAVAQHAEIHYGTEESYLGDEGLLEFVNDFVHGLTLVRAAELDAEPWALAVLDPASVQFRGGTRHFLDNWGGRGRNTRTIDLANLRSEVEAQEPDWCRSISSVPSKKTEAGREVKIMLFADVKNYSCLKDQEAPAFFLEFLTQVGQVIQTMRRYPAHCNTWGDGLFVVFNDVLDAAEFALDLLRRIESTDFTVVGLPADTTVRIGLHAGPVYPQWDRLIGRVNFFGTHVNRAARIEPKTPPGCIYATEQFAAILATTPDHRYVCEYVGMHVLGKEHDQFRCRLYNLRQQED